MSEDRRGRNYIDGAWREPDATGALPVENPSTGEVIGTVPVSSSAEVDRANMPAQQLGTTATVPLATPGLIGGLTCLPPTRQEEGQPEGIDGAQLYLVIEVGQVEVGE